MFITFLYLNLKEKHKKKRNTCLIATVHGRHEETGPFLFPNQNSCKLFFNASSNSAKWENGGDTVTMHWSNCMQIYNSSSQWLLILTWQMQWQCSTWQIQHLCASTIYVLLRPS